MSTILNDVAVAETQVTVPARTDRPNKKFNPSNAITTSDTIEIIAKQNGVEKKSWSYSPSIPAKEGYKLTLVATLRIEEVPE